MYKFLVIIGVLIFIFSGCSNKGGTIRYTNPAVKKLDINNKTIIALTSEGLYSLPEDSTVAERIKFPEDLAVIDFAVVKEIIYVLGISENKIKLFSGEKNSWKQLTLPAQINTYFADKLSNVNLKKEDLPKIISGNIYLKKDKTLIIFTKDALYFESGSGWTERKIPDIKNAAQNFANETGISEVCEIRDSIIFESFSSGEIGGISLRCDLREAVPKWETILGDYKVTAIITDSLQDAFWYSVGEKDSLPKGKLEYYKNGKTELLSSFDDTESVKKFNMNQKNPVLSFYKNKDEIYILTNESVFFYREKYIKKILYFLDLFNGIFADNKGNIYLYTKKEGLTKYVNTGEGYQREPVSFIHLE